MADLDPFTTAVLEPKSVRFSAAAELDWEPRRVRFSTAAISIDKLSPTRGSRSLRSAEAEAAAERSEFDRSVLCSPGTDSIICRPASKTEERRSGSEKLSLQIYTKINKN